LTPARKDAAKRETRYETKRKPHEVVTLAELGIDASTVGAAGAATSVGGLSKPAGRGDTIVLEDDGTAAEQLLAFLVEKKVVA
jgi:electron transfer flavoprotein beta subunit